MVNFVDLFCWFFSFSIFVICILWNGLHTSCVLGYFPFSLKVLLIRKKSWKSLLFPIQNRFFFLPGPKMTSLIVLFPSDFYSNWTIWIQLSCTDESTTYNENKWQCLKYRENWRHFNTSFVPFYKILQKCFQFDQ